MPREPQHPAFDERPLSTNELSRSFGSRMIPFQAPCAAGFYPTRRPSPLSPVASVPPPPPPPKQRRSSITGGGQAGADYSFAVLHNLEVKVTADGGRNSKASVELLCSPHAVWRSAVEVSACYGTVVV